AVTNMSAVAALTTIDSSMELTIVSSRVKPRARIASESKKAGDAGEQTAAIGLAILIGGFGCRFVVGREDEAAAHRADLDPNLAASGDAPVAVEDEIRAAAEVGMGEGGLVGRGAELNRARLAAAKRVAAQELVGVGGGREPDGAG